LIFIGCGFLLLKRWQSYELMDQVSLIDKTSGILLTDIDTLGLEKIQLEVLRDPAAQSVGD
jgi:hypothetical protein